MPIRCGLREEGLVKYKLRTLSPLHIGCGETYNGLNYILQNKKIYIVNLDFFIEYLGADKSGKFSIWLEQNSNEISLIDSKIRIEKRRDPKSDLVNRLRTDLRKKKQNFTLINFIKTHLSLSEQPSLINKLTDHSIYSAASSSKVFNDIEIISFIKQMRLPYIPGTEIKGAIRTAILYCTFVDDKKIHKELEQEVNKMLNDSVGRNREFTFKEYIDAVKNQRKPDDKIKKALVDSMGTITKLLEDKIFNSRPNDAKHNVMKFIQIGDSTLLDYSNLSVSYAEPYNISSKFRTYNEYLNPGIDIPITSFKTESDNSKNIKIDKMGFSKVQQQIASLKSILHCCYQFSQDTLEEEIGYFEKHGKINIVKHLQMIATFNTPESPVLRIGKDEGYNSVTIGLAVKKIMPELYNDVLIHTTKGKSYDEKHGGPLPKSRKIVQWNKSELTAGWVQLIPDEQPVKIISSKKINEEIPKQEETVSKIDLSVLRKKFN